MTCVELPTHDRNRFGPLRAAEADRPELVRLGDLVEALCLAHDCAPPDAAQRLIERITTARLYRLRLTGDALPIDTAEYCAPDGKCFACFDLLACHRPAGPGPLLQCVAIRWVERARELAESPACLARIEEAMSAVYRTGAIAYLAMLRRDAVSSFPEVFGSGVTVQTPAPALPVTKQVIQPAGGAWPHPPEQPWTDAEREALFEMRHRFKFTGKELGKVAKCTRQRIDEVIGSAKPHGGAQKANAKDGWKPSAELLSRCGLPLQPLQSTAASLRAA